MHVLYIKIDGITCDNCRNTIKKELLNINNIKDVKITKNIAKVSYLKEINEIEIIEVINKLGYFTKKDYISKNIKDINSSMKLKEFVIILFSILLVIFLIKKIFGYDIFNVIPTINDNITYSMLFVIGLLISIHCISMCGAINLMATYNRENKINLKRPIIYNLGRLTSYTFLV